MFRKTEIPVLGVESVVRRYTGGRLVSSNTGITLENSLLSASQTKNHYITIRTDIRRSNDIVYFRILCTTLVYSLRAKHTIKRSSEGNIVTWIFVDPMRLHRLEIVPYRRSILYRSRRAMANLNFEQPPRSIANASLTSRASAGGGLNSVTLAGHVTPTSGMFSGSSASTSSSANSTVVVTNVYPGVSGSGGAQTSHQPQQQLSPMGSRGLFGQRAFTDRRTMPALGTSNPMGNMGSFGIPPSRNYGSQGAINNFHSVFGSGGGGDTSTPPLLDLSEFPSLTNRGQGDSMPQPSPMPGKQPYVGMVKQPTSESSEFTMSSEDFPALPGTQNREGPSPGGSVSGDKSISVGLGPEIGQDVLQANRAPGSEKSQASKRGIQTSPDGKVTNIPASMVKDQFGMVGLLTFIRAAETDPNLVSLALGQDLTALGLNLNSPENLYQNFGGPWAETPCRPQDIDFHVPPEYLINAAIRDKLAPVKLNRYKDDLLFYMFYTNVGDVLQLAAAAELYSREWRYHMEEKVWITQAPGLGLVEKTSTYERGTYYYFDAQNWRKVAKEFHLDYTKLESRPHLPTNFHQTQP